MNLWIFLFLASTVFAEAPPPTLEKTHVPKETIGALKATPLLELEWIRLESYKPIYFLMGSPDVKAQLSLKTQLIHGVNLYGGYTQLIMWDMFHSSAPVRDVNYNPEIFYRYYSNDKKTFLDFGFYEHESNGGFGGPSTRSWDRSYIRIYRNNFIGEKNALGWSFKTFVPYRYDEQNRDITQYRGLWEAQVSITRYFGFLFDIDEVIFRFYPGGKERVNPLKGGRELTFRGKASIRDHTVPLIFQIFQGTGENLLDYRDKHWGFRAGFGF